MAPAWKKYTTAGGGGGDKYQLWLVAPLVKENRGVDQPELELEILQKQKKLLKKKKNIKNIPLSWALEVEIRKNLELKIVLQYSFTSS